MKTYKIVEKKYLWFTLSISFMVLALVFSLYRMFNQIPILNYGIDFTGGSTLLLKMDKLDTLYAQEKVNKTTKNKINIAFIEDLRTILKEFGLEKSQIQITQDKEIIIRTTPLDNNKRLEIIAYLQQKLGNIVLLEADTIGPTIGNELKSKALWMILFVTGALLLYITWRFEFSFGLSAVLSLIHDSLFIISFACIFYLEVDSQFIAALLTILGYSLNDTVVLFDRVRENLKLNLKNITLSGLINTSISQVFRRTVNTSVTTLMVVLSLIIFGGTTIKTFSVLLFMGILVGTYSSIFIACPVLPILLGENKK
jgi:preprotein translocase subunit SecF